MRQKRRTTNRIMTFMTLAAMAVTLVPRVQAASAPHVEALAPAPKPVTAAELHTLRGKASAMAASTDPTRAAGGKRLLLWLDVLEASKPVDRHAAIRRLPVTISVSVATDGRRGVIKSFVAGGKVRQTLFVPESPLPSSDPFVAAETEQAHGPFVPVDSTTGRWKSDGFGGCYWDPEEDGPNQCWPGNPGRWKSDGFGGCYWDAEDDGPDQCEPPSSNCYYDGVPADCATAQEIEDALIVLAGIEAENEYQQAVAEATEAELLAFCNQNPWACEELPDLEGVLSGPNVCTEGEFASCTSKGWLAFGAVASSILFTSGAVALAASPAPPAAGVLFAVGTAVGAVAGSIAAVTEYVDCKIALMAQAPLSDYAFEPVY